MNRTEKIYRIKFLLKDVLRGFEEPIDVLTFSADGEDNLLHEAAMLGNLEAVKLLFDLGIDINATGDMNQTALHYAAAFGYYDIYDFLVSKGAKTDVVNQLGQTPQQRREQAPYKEN